MHHPVPESHAHNSSTRVAIATFLPLECEPLLLYGGIRVWLATGYNRNHADITGRMVLQGAAEHLVAAVERLQETGTDQTENDADFLEMLADLPGPLLASADPAAATTQPTP